MTYNLYPVDVQMTSLFARFLSRATTASDNSSNAGQSEDADSFMGSARYNLSDNGGSDDAEDLPEGIPIQPPPTHFKNPPLHQSCLMWLDVERRVAQVAVNIGIRALLLEVKRAEEYKILDDLKFSLPPLPFPKKNIKTYPRAALLSPMITSYRSNVADIVIDAMAELNVHNLPDPADSTRVEKVLGEMGRVLTVYRSGMNNKLKASLEDDSITENIADLASALIGDRPVQPTLDRYVRLAVLRNCLAGDASASDAPAPAALGDQFWLMVDNTIEELREAEKEIKEYVVILPF
ncbi:hypothetical protein CVT26_014520 [Gymnopilus dilepis]|uniref:Uncharacterized protein n=1 Tax=Gymnopilus dilepis TaxID=231916 RepID=A0A409W3B9_9AGAR|nr:hypothetical protein CVT26_014520 [Gymnopilus dilepis]